LALQVLVHDNEKNPLMQERGLLISAGFITRVAVEAEYVSVWQIIK
jgi:hypothetical protein